MISKAAGTAAIFFFGVEEIINIIIHYPRGENTIWNHVQLQ